MSGIYVHVPFCASKCAYCDFASYPREIEKAEAYFACLYKEIRMRAPALSGMRFDTLYFGGGTPSFVKPEYLLGAARQVRKYLDLAADAEITVELNPGSIDRDKLAVYRSFGANRYSVGLQSADDRLLREIGRVHTAEDFRNAADLLAGENFSADVMYGLPGQDGESVLRAISLAADAGASHISAYALKAEEGTPMYARYLNGDLPSEDEAADQYDLARAELSRLGYRRYEVSNFARPGKESRHNLNYWRRGEYIGFGVAAASFVGGRRFSNTENIDDYVRCVLLGRAPEIFSEEIGDEEARSEYAMLTLRTERGADLAEYRAAFGREFREDFADAIAKNAAVLDVTDERVAIRGEYLYVQNTILCDFLR